MGRHRWIVGTVWVAILAANAGASYGAGSLTDLGYLSSMNKDTEQPHVSNDGTVVTGKSMTDAGAYLPFRWTAATGMQAIPLPVGYTGGAGNALSPDASTIVGVAGSATIGAEAFRWSAATGTVLMGDVAGVSRKFSSALAIAGDNQTVVGYASGSRSAMWTAAGGPTIPAAFAGASTEGISADGSMIAGEVGAGVYRWTAADGTVQLPQVSGAQGANFGALSSDGSTIVGDSYMGYFTNWPKGGDTPIYRAFRWTAAGGVQDLGTIGPEPLHTWTYTNCVNADGSVIGGSYRAWNGTLMSDDVAFVWDQQHGMRSLSDILADVGVSTQGWALASVTGISANGLTFVGEGTHNGVEGGFIATVPEPAAGFAIIAAITSAVSLRRQPRRTARVVVDLG